MSFVSLPFIIFITITVAIYFLLPKRFQWLVLLVSSYVFFWLNSEWLLFILLGTTIVTFLTAHWISRLYATGKQYVKDHAETLSRQEKREYDGKLKKKAKRILLCGVIIVLGLLLFLKYFNFFAENANVFLKYANVKMPKLNLLLPIGISFYTLQAIAYMVDVYRGKYEADTNVVKFMLFMSYFPQIIQGPIARFDQLAHQLYEKHSFDYKRFTFGIQLIIWGWMKKVIVADRIAIPANYIFDNHSQYTGLMVFLGAAFYGFQVYADFSGGMDIARGVSQIFGIELELNFKQPYFSKSIEEFWRRWHITLGSWMRDYVFYPLSLSKLFGKLSKKTRKIFGPFLGKRLPSLLSMFIVYFLVGFWHGPTWKYIIYGVWNGVFIMSGILLVEVYSKCRKKCGIAEDDVSWKVFQIFRTFIIITLGRFFSRASGGKVALAMMTSMTKKWYDFSFLVDGSLFKLGLDNANWILLIVALVVMFAVDCIHEKNISIRETIAKQNIVFRWTIYYAALVLIWIFGMYGPGYDSAGFIYGQF